jgi:hypothetical protein
MYTILFKSIAFLDIIHRTVFIQTNTTFWRLHPVSIFRWNLLSWSQSMETVPVSGPREYKFKY